MSIEQRGNKFRVRLTHKGTPYKGTFASKPEAEAWVADIKSKIHLGREITFTEARAQKEMTLKKLFSVTSQNIWEKQKDWVNTSMVIGKILRYFGDDVLAKHISLRHLEDYVQYMYKNGASPATCNRHLAKISKALNYGLQHNYVLRVPHIPRQKEEEGEIVWWNKDEERAILDAIDAIDNEPFRKFFEWQIDTGIRPNESRNLHRALLHFDELNNCWMVQIPKNVAKWGGGRTVPLTPRAKKAWDYACKETNREMPFERWTNGANRDVWNMIRKELSNTDDKFIFYCTRHSCATRLLQGGLDIYRVKDWLGHRNISTTEKYAKLVPTNLVSGLSILAG